MKRWVQMADNKDNDLTVFNQTKLPGNKIIKKHVICVETFRLSYRHIQFNGKLG